MSAPTQSNLVNILFPSLHFLSPCTISRHRDLLDERAKAIGEAKSSNPALFMPLRLQCSLKRRGVSGGGPGGGGSGNAFARPRRQAGREVEAQEAMVPATMSLRGEMVIPAVGIRLTPIAPLALLHTALYQSLLTRGAEDKLQSG